MSDLALPVASSRPYRIGFVTGDLLVAVARGWLTLVTGLIAWSVLPILIGWHPVLVTGASMTPVIQPGDVVLVDPDLATAPGRIVVAHGTRADGQNVMHRVVGVSPDGTVTTKGDANATADTTPVPAGNVDGGVRLVIPGAGRLALGLLALKDRHVPFGRTDGLWLGGTLLALLIAAPRARRRSEPPGSAGADRDDVLDDRVRQ